MKRKLCLLLCVVFLFALALSGCSKYHKANIVGLSKEQVLSYYGDFDLNGAPFITTDSSYRGYGYGYLVKESRVGFLGTHPAEYFFIVFDSNGIATDCYKGHHLNGG